MRSPSGSEESDGDQGEHDGVGGDESNEVLHGSLSVGVASLAGRPL
jgi:hypothetical protein